MAANYYYSKSKGCIWSGLVKGDTAHRPGRIRYTIMEGRDDIRRWWTFRGEEIGPTLLETKSYGERIYGICTYQSDKNCQVKPPIKSLFGHKRDDSPTYS